MWTRTADSHDFWKHFAFRVGLKSVWIFWRHLEIVEEKGRDAMSFHSWFSPWELRNPWKRWPVVVVIMMVHSMLWQLAFVFASKYKLKNNLSLNHTSEDSRRHNWCERNTQFTYERCIPSQVCLHRMEPKRAGQRGTKTVTNQ